MSEVAHSEKTPDPNFNTETQIRFKSTKKQRTSLTKYLSKPDRGDVEKCTEEMDEVHVVVVCGICLLNEDRTCQGLVKWIECELCDIWYHESCAEVDTDEEDTFICKFCCF